MARCRTRRRRSNVAAGNYTLTAKAYERVQQCVVDGVGCRPAYNGERRRAPRPVRPFFSIDNDDGPAPGRERPAPTGRMMVNDSATLPPYATLTTTAPNWTWAGSSADPRALQKSAGADRIAATWYGYAITAFERERHRRGAAPGVGVSGRLGQRWPRGASGGPRCEHQLAVHSRTVSGFGGGQGPDLDYSGSRGPSTRFTCGRRSTRL